MLVKISFRKACVASLTQGTHIHTLTETGAGREEPSQQGLVHWACQVELLLSVNTSVGVQEERRKAYSEEFRIYQETHTVPIRALNLKQNVGDALRGVPMKGCGNTKGAYSLLMICLVSFAVRSPI